MIRDLSDLVIVALLVGLTVTILSSLADSKLKKWRREGQEYKAWIAFSICFVGALAFAIVPRVFEAHTTGATGNIAVPSVSPIFPSEEHFRIRSAVIAFYVTMMFFLVFVPGQLVSRGGYSRRSIIYLCGQAGIIMIFVAIGLTCFQMIATLGAVPSSYAPTDLKPRLLIFAILVVCEFVALFVCTAVAQMASTESDIMGRRREIILFPLIGFIGYLLLFGATRLLAG